MFFLIYEKKVSHISWVDFQYTYLLFCFLFWFSMRWDFENLNLYILYDGAPTAILSQPSIQNFSGVESGPFAQILALSRDSFNFFFKIFSNVAAMLYNLIKTMAKCTKMHLFLALWNRQCLITHSDQVSIQLVLK